jgi:hypothetical protein
MEPEKVEIYKRK